MLETITYNNCNILISPNEYALNPLINFDLLTRFFTWHKSYNLGNDHQFRTPNEFIQYYKITHKNNEYISSHQDILLIKPLYLYDHSSLSLSTTPFSCRWDSGQVGFVMMLRSDILCFYNKKKITKKIQQEILQTMENDIALYNHYLEGDVYRYECKTKEGRFIDACSGYYGYDHQQSGLLRDAKSHIDSYLQQNHQR